ncbi:MAG TPA: endospore germination permease [Bacillota bacterium]|nr:endospore germination permease [Bacillota bacterium]HPO98888.1 endospore germination permease [Bacillota bacterium]
MQLEAGKISGSELIFIVVAFIFGSSILLLPGLDAENMGWLAIICGLILGIGFASIYTTLAMRFPGKNFVEISEAVFGKLIGKFIAVAFLGYLFHLGSLVVTDYHNFIKLILLVETPSSVIVLFALLIISYGVWHGIEVLGRVAQGMVILTVGLTLLSFVLLTNKMDFNNFLPLFDLPLKQFLWASYGTGTFPFGEVVAFLMIFAALDRPKQIRALVFKGMIYGWMFLFFASIRTIAILGPTMEIFVYPVFQTSKLISIADVFTRLEIITGIVFLMMGFLKIGILLYGAAIGTAQLFQLNSYRTLVLPLGLLMGLVALINFPNVIENIKHANDIYPIYATVFILVIPSITLVVAIIRRLPKNERGN